ncbi:ribosomal protein 63, mitochondrial [Pararge aegeria]|uniref:Jg5064 protein n=2 Tax=Pararge aegeria TaxID=116150 RepID=A0A8S4R7M4_9NEOP|nr:ribosomal protein 63, mitochondrial [Pararge aegeria]CAH2230387.1 jg5064 [Pararge aegeria aegeria]
MKLTLCLLRRNRLPNGNIFRGKDRLVKQVEPKHLRRLERSFVTEEQNMFYLRHPYLTEEESCGHAKALGKHEARKMRFQENSNRMFKEDVTLYERLQHLRVKEGWE